MRARFVIRRTLYDIISIMKRAELEEQIRQVILSSVEVDGLTAADLPAEASLFGEGVGLDSIDALEIGGEQGAVPLDCVIGDVYRDESGPHAGGLTT